MKINKVKEMLINWLIVLLVIKLRKIKINKQTKIINNK
jgi:hypothetical protein